MYAYKRPIHAIVKKNGRNLTCEIESVSRYHGKQNSVNNWFAMPEALNTLAGEAEWYAKISYIIAFNT